MPLPGNTTTVTVAGTFLEPDGDPAAGTITFTPSEWLTNSVDNISIPALTITKTLGTAGDFTALLPVTDDADLSPNGWHYTVTEAIGTASRRYDIVLPGSAATAGTVWLGDLAPASPVGPAYYSLASSLTIGTVTSLAPGGTATATISGLAPNQLLNLGIPAGPAGQVTMGTTGVVAYPGPGTVTNSGTSGTAILNFTLVSGPPNTLTVGTVTTLAYGSAATATVSGTAPSQVLDLGIPQGVPGDLSPAGQAAAGSAIAAAGSADASATLAAASAGSADASAGLASAAAGSASASAGSASASAGSADASAIAAAASAGSASASAGSAASSASDASTSATNALGYLSSMRVLTAQFYA